MKKIYLFLVLFFLFSLTGCQSVSGTLNNPYTYKSEVFLVFDQKKVNRIIKDIKKREIKKKIGTPIPSNQVAYFQEPSLPQECHPIGYISVDLKKGYRSNHKILIMKKAAKLGIHAVNDFTMGTGGKLTLLYKFPNSKELKRAIQYSKYEYSILTYNITLHECKNKEKCKKKKYKTTCLRRCALSHGPKTQDLIRYTVTALKCDKNYLKKLQRDDNNIDSLYIENKFKSLFK